jgi:tagatose-1,6-bisphosphate aldolase
MDITSGATDVARSLAHARALDAISGSGGVVIGVAVDHRDALQRALGRRGLELSDVELGSLKARITRALAPLATVVLLDVEHGVGPAMAGAALPGNTALCIPLEAQGYGDAAAAEQTSFLPGWSPLRARAIGAVACKLLLPYRVDVPDQATRQEAVVQRAVEGCREAGVALILEPIVYPRPDERSTGNGSFAELVVEGATRLAQLGPDVLKLQHPGSAAACRELDSACGAGIPWVVLGGGADPDTLLVQVEEACRAGASGFIVGRTLWDGVLDAGAAADQERLLAERAVPLLQQLAFIARKHATPWRNRLPPIPIPPSGWHLA